MSKATKRKHVTRQVLEDYVTPTDTQSIVKVGLLIVLCMLTDCVWMCSVIVKFYMFCPSQIVCGRGNNLHEVETAEGGTYLVTMPTRFRKNVWIKRGEK